jgi:hypothetical protein
MSREATGPGPSPGRRDARTSRKLGCFRYDWGPPSLPGASRAWAAMGRPPLQWNRKGPPASLETGHASPCPGPKQRCASPQPCQCPQQQSHMRVRVCVGAASVHKLAWVTLSHARVPSHGTRGCSISPACNNNACAFCRGRIAKQHHAVGSIDEIRQCHMQQVVHDSMPAPEKLKSDISLVLT